MRAFWRHVTSAPDEPIVRERVKVQEEVIVVDELPDAVPVRAALTFAIVPLSAPKDERSESMDWICAWESDAAYAVEELSIVTAIATPAATAAIFVIALVVTNFCINNLVKILRAHLIIKV
jgi:hypothetical protein